MPATEIVAIVKGIVGCVAGVSTTPFVQQPVAEFFGYLKEEPHENLQKLKDQDWILEDLIVAALSVDPRYLDSEWGKDALKVRKKIAKCIYGGTGVCFNLCSCLAEYQKRCRVGKYTPKIEKQVTRLRNELRQKLGIHVAFEEEVGKFVATRRFLVGREGVIRDIMSKYEETTHRLGVTRIFGVYGAIGVGKTEAVAHVCNRILLDYGSPLTSFIWFEAASYEDDLQKLQRKIGHKFKLELPMDNSVWDNAVKLEEKLLKNVDILLVLDNVRKAFSLEEIGIPTNSNSKSKITIVITSRSLSVCNQMKCDWKIGLKSLSDEEAHELLINEVGFLRTSSTEEIQSSLKKIASKCGGLPLAIVAVANYLRKFHGYDLITMNRCLKTNSATFSNLKYIEDKVFQELMLSYERLKHGSYSCAKECLLFCTMYPRNYAFVETELMIYWMGEGLLHEVEGIDEKLGEAKEILEELKDASLLESITCENGIETVKMHPLVWDMAIKFEEENHRFFSKRECRLEKIEYNDWSEAVERVSLVKNNLKELPTAPINFLNLSTLILRGNPLDIQLHHDFFNSFPNLKILDLSDTQVRLLPKSISCLKQLTVLLLRNCIYLSCLPSLSELVALMVLDISGCRVKELPSLLGLVALMVLDTSGCRIEELPSLSRLVQLMILNASDCPIKKLPHGMNHLTNVVCLNLSRTRVRIFPSHLVAGLNNLQELSTFGCNFSWILRPTMQGDNAACIEDVQKPQHLIVLDIDFSNLQVYEFYANSPHCDRLRSFRFCVGEWFEGELRNNSVAFTKQFPRNQFLLPKNTSELLLKNCGNVTPLTIPTDAIYLRNLKFLDVSYCKNLKCLFKFEKSLVLHNLEELVISNCANLNKVIETEKSDSLIHWPRLRKLTLFELPELRFINDNEIRTGSLQAIGIWNCPKLEKLPISLRIDDEQKLISPSSLKEIRGDKSWLENLKQRSPDSCEVTFLEKNLIEEPSPEEYTEIQES